MPFCAVLTCFHVFFWQLGPSTFFYFSNHAIVFKSLRKLDMNVLILFFQLNNYALLSLFLLSSYFSVINVQQHKNKSSNY